MEQNSINIRQERSFGEVFNVSFAFIGQEFKTLGTAILIYVVPFILLTLIVSNLVMIEYKNLMSGMLENLQYSDPTYMQDNFSDIFRIYNYIIPMYLVIIITMSMLNCTIYGYMKLYIEKGKGEFKATDVGGVIKKYIFPTILTNIVCIILILIGSVLCLIPGIYLAVSLSLIFAALVYEGKGFGTAFERTFSLVKQKWWETFGMIILIYIIIMIVLMIVYIPFMGGFFKSMISIKEPGEVMDKVFSSSFTIMNAIITLITYILYAVPTVVLGFQYFSLAEMKDRPSLQEKIDQI